MKSTNLIDFFNNKAKNSEHWTNKNKYYYNDIEKICRFLIPEKSNVVEIGCGTGNLISSLNPKEGLGIDISPEMIKAAKERHPDVHYEVMDAHNIELDSTYDFILMSNLISYLQDIQTAFTELRKISDERTRIIITNHNYLWEPMLEMAEKLGQRAPQPFSLNWLSDSDIENLLNISGFEIIKKGKRFLVPKNIPVLSNIFNKYLYQLPIIKNLCLTSYFVAKQINTVSNTKNKYSVSVVIPARNEKGNIESAVKRMPKMGKKTEIIFVEGGSSDNTWDEIQRVYKKNKNKENIKIMQQEGRGKGDAVRKGFDAATGDILMILDADLTVMPEDLTKFYDVIASGKGEFINGSRLVYQMEDQAMRFLNLLGNKFFSLLFTWLLDQRFKDTLCGTKVIFSKDYKKLQQGRKYFGEFDPFGDFDLIFGASKLNLKIVELPIRYKERTYGDTNISRFRHGLLLFRMCIFAARKIKFI